MLVNKTNLVKCVHYSYYVGISGQYLLSCYTIDMQFNSSTGA